MIILFLSGILFLLSVLVGGFRGVKCFAVLIYNAIIMFVSVMLLSHGFNVFFIMIISSLLFILLTVFYQNGFNVKTVVTVVSVVITLLFMAFIIYYIAYNSHISGLNEIELEEGNNFLYYSVNVDMLKILIVSTAWSVLGAIIDTSMSIASSVNEIYTNNPLISIRRIFKSGVNLGNDILGTTVNTLVFVGFGESLMLIIYYIENNYTISQIINLKSFFQEISVVLISCIACALIIPITVLCFCIVLLYKRHVNENNTEVD